MIIYRDEKILGLYRTILFVEIFPNIKCSGFLTFILLVTFNVGKYFYE